MNDVEAGLFRKARRALRSVEAILDVGDGEGAVQLAYNAMFYAAKAALNSVGEDPRTQRGTHLRFHLHFIRSGRLERGIGRMLSRGHDRRHRNDRDAVQTPDAYALSDLYAEAERFVNSVEEMLLAGPSEIDIETVLPPEGLYAIQDFQGDGGPTAPSARHRLLATLRRPDPHLASLTRREREVLGLLVEGRTCPQIAEALFVAPSTVCFHVRHIYEKLQVHTRGQAVAYALGRRRS